MAAWCTSLPPAPTHAYAQVLSLPGAYQDTAFASTLMTHARQLYGLAKAYPGIWTPPNGGLVTYPSSTYLDDMAWAASWLCRVGGSSSLYCSDATAYWDQSFVQQGNSLNSDW